MSTFEIRWTPNPEEIHLSYKQWKQVVHVDNFLASLGKPSGQPITAPHSQDSTTFDARPLTMCNIARHQMRLEKLYYKNSLAQLNTCKTVADALKLSRRSKNHCATSKRKRNTRLLNYIQESYKPLQTYCPAVVADRMDLQKEPQENVGDTSSVCTTEASSECSSSCLNLSETSSQSSRSSILQLTDTPPWLIGCPDYDEETELCYQVDSHNCDKLSRTCDSLTSETSTEPPSPQNTSNSARIFRQQINDLLHDDDGTSLPFVSDSADIQGLTTMEDIDRLFDYLHQPTTTQFDEH